MEFLFEFDIFRTKLSQHVASIVTIATPFSRIGDNVIAPQIILDLSPIARIHSQQGQTADWSRVESVIAAWREQEDATATFIGVADRSLYNHLNPSGKLSLKKWEKRGLASVVSFADQKILELAEQYPDAKVITSDLFRAERREFGWLNDSNRVIRPKFNDGTVSFVVQTLTPLTPHLESRYIEKRELNYRKMTTPEAERALEWEWGCSNPKCELSQVACFDTLPAFFNGVIKCPKCFQQAKQLGSCVNTRELVIQIAGREVRRVALPEGMSLHIGRGRGVDHFDVRPFLDKEYSRLVSRAHLKLTNRTGRIIAQDLHSKNGTMLIRDDGAVHKALLPDVEQVMELSDTISLARGILSLRISGKKLARGKYEPRLNQHPAAEIAE